MLAFPKHFHKIAAGIVCIISTNAYSGGFALIENSGSGAGNAYAGAAARTEDPSVIWFNPASMMSMSGQNLSVGGHIVSASSKFENKGTAINPLLGGSDISGGEGDPAGVSFVPNLYYVQPLNSDMSFGLSINAPFGSDTKYDKDWVGRYHAVESAVLSININPSLAWRVSDELSLGAGLSAQYFHVTLSNAIDSGSVCLGSLAPNNAAKAECVKAGLTPANQEHDSFGELEGDGWAFNFNLGLNYNVSEKTNIGLSYRSKIDHDLEGEADFDIDTTLQQFLTAAGTTAFTDSDISAKAKLPASLIFGITHQLDDKLQLLGGITWTQWSTFKELRVNFDNPAQPDSVTPEEWEDVMRYSIGLNYKKSDVLTLRAGLAFDEEPIPSAKRRTPRIPGTDRTWISFGAGYKFSDKLDVDFGYSHLFLDEAPIDHTDESLGHTTLGLYDSAVDIISAQLNWHF